MDPHPDDYDPATGKLLPADQRHRLPYGMVVAEDPSVQADQRTDNVFFSCAACHTARVYIDGRVRHFVGGPNTEFESQAYAGLLNKTGKALIKPDTPGIDRTQVHPAQVAKIMVFLKTKADTDPAWFYGGRTPAERDAKALRAKTQVAHLLEQPKTAIGALVGPAIKTEFMYIKLASRFYTEKDGQMAPGLFWAAPWAQRRVWDFGHPGRTARGRRGGRCHRTER